MGLRAMWMIHRRLATAASLIVLMAFCLDRAQAADWHLTPTLQAGVIASDNITLAPPGQESSDTINEYIPGLTLTANGKRLDLSVDYRLDILRYQRYSDRDTEYHLLDSSLHSTVLPGFFFVDASANRSQTTFFTDETTPANRFSISENLTEVASNTVTPYITPTFGTFATGLVKASIIDVRYPDPDFAVNNLDNREYVAELHSGEDFKQVSWMVGYRRTDFDLTQGDTDRYEKTSLGLAYHLTAKLDLTGEYGEEKSNRTSIPSSELWSVGFRWRPTPRTSLDASIGHGIFGQTAEVNFLHNTRHGNFTVDYHQEVTDASSILLERRRIFPELDQSGNPINPNDPAFIDVIVGVPVADTFVRKTLGAGMSFIRRHVSYGINGSYERREFLSSDDVDDVEGIQLFAQWRMSSRSGVDGNIYDQKFKFGNDSREDFVRRQTLSFFHNFSRDLVARLTLTRYAVSSSIEGLGYFQHNVEATLSYAF